MFRNDTVYCPDCGGILQSCGDDRFVICRRCGGKVSAQMLMYKTVQQPKEQRALIPVLCGLSMLLLPFPLGLLLILLIVPLLSRLEQKTMTDKMQQKLSAPVGAGDRFRTPDDLLAAFRLLPLTYMPLRAEAGEAIAQLNQLNRKQLAIRALLEKDHPFRKSADDAAAYIMNNCKQILYRLQYCDQNDLSLREMHQTYLRGLLDENARVLQDFERLIIEITQMNDSLPAPVPSLDVLADTLYSIRTGEPEPPADRRMIS